MGANQADTLTTLREQELWLETDNDFDSVRHNPAFVALCERVKQRRVTST